MNDAVRQTLLSRVYEVADETKLEHAGNLSNELGQAVYLKREDLQPVHSFKLRGAYNKIVQLTQAEQTKGVIAASAGNHAQGVALSAQKLGLSALIVMPKTTPAIKIDAVRSYGAEVVLAGNSYSEAYEHCLQLITSTKRTFIHPFDDPLVIAGQGTIGREILEQLPKASHIFVPVGGGGLIAGIAQYVKQLRPDIKIIGVEPEDSNAMQTSVKAGKRVSLEHVGIFADGVAVKQVGQLTFELVKKYVDEIITVNIDQVCSAIKSIFEDTRSIVEPAGALSVAGMRTYVAHHKLDGAHLVAICSGANMSFERLQFIAERTLVGSGREALYAVTLPEQAGALKTFCNSVVNGYSISEFGYRMCSRKKASIFVGITFSNKEDKLSFVTSLKKHDYAYCDLSLDELAKEHIRHMIGGPSQIKIQELMYEVNFPERPGALNNFLRIMGERWSISLFHYRGQGADVGRVLIGFETDQAEELEKTLALTNCEFARANSVAAKLFL